MLPTETLQPIYPHDPYYAPIDEPDEDHKATLL